MGFQFSIPFIIFALLFSLRPSRNSVLFIFSQKVTSTGMCSKYCFFSSTIVVSVSVSAATRLAYDTCMYLDRYVRTPISPFFFCLEVCELSFSSQVCDLFQLLCIILILFFICFPPEVIFRSRVTGACPVTTDCIVAMSSCENNEQQQ